MAGVQNKAEFGLDNVNFVPQALSLCSPHGGYLRGAWCPFCYAEAVKKALERFSQVYWKISGGNQLAGRLERWMSLIPLLLFLLWKLADLGAGAMVHFPVLSLTHKHRALPPPLGFPICERRYLFSGEYSS